MSSRRTGNGGTPGRNRSGQYNGGSHGNSPSHASNAALAQDMPSSFSIRRRNPEELRALLRRVFQDDDDTTFSRRLTSAKQLLALLDEYRDLEGADLLPFRRECTHLIGECLYGPGLRLIFEVAKAPLALKQACAKIVAVIGGNNNRIDVPLAWLLENTNQCTLDKTISATARAKERERTMWYLRTFNMLLTEIGTRSISCQALQITAPALLANISSVLDAMDTSDYFPEILRALNTIASLCHNAFAAKFQDIIDLLIGWYIDVNADLDDEKRAAILDSFQRYQSFWDNHLPFASELMQHFLSDIEGFLHQIQTTAPAESTTVQSKWGICLNLLRCFHEILETVIPLIDARSKKDANDVAGRMLDALRPKTIEFLIKAMNASPDTHWLHISDQIVLQMVSIRPESFQGYQSRVFHYLSLNTVSGPTHSVQMLMRTIHACSPNIDAEKIMYLLDVDSSPLFRWRTEHPTDKSLNADILVLFRVLIRLAGSNHITAPVSEKLVEKLHSTLAEVFSSYSTIDLMSPFRQLSNLVTQTDTHLPQYKNTHRPSASTASSNVLNALFYGYILLDMATIWSVGREQHIGAILRMLCQTWQYRCFDMFDTCLQMLIDFWTKSSRMAAEELSLQVALIADCADHWDALTLRSRQAICDFVEQMLQQPTVQLNESDMRDIIIRIIHATDHERNNHVKGRLLHLISQYCQEYRSTDILLPAISLVQRGVDDTCGEIQKISKQLLDQLNIFLLADIAKQGNAAFSNIKKICMATPHTGSFRPAHYEIVMRNLGMTKLLLNVSGNHPDPNTTQDADWAKRLFHNCSSLKNMQSTSIYEDVKEGSGNTEMVNLINHSQSLLYYWAIWESARYCILARLRTPFGGPQQTFAAFERQLDALVTADDQCNRQVAISVLSCAGTHMMASRQHLQHLLVLLDRLETQIYNASEGCTTGALPAVPRPSLLFFRGNRKTCQDYFSRIRPNMIRAAKLIGDNDLFVRHALQTLKEREASLTEQVPENETKWFMDTNILLRELVHTCIRQKQADIIQGFHSWYKRLIRKMAHIKPSFLEHYTFRFLIGPLPKASYESQSQSVSWFHIAAMFASGHDEAAIKSLQRMDLHVDNDPFGIIKMLNAETLRFYASLEDYEQIEKLCGDNTSMFSDAVFKSLMEFSHQQEQLQTNHSDFTLGDLQSYIDNTSIESSLDIASLERYRHWLGMTNSSTTTNEDINDFLAQRLWLTLSQDVLSDRCKILEYQLQQTTTEKLLFQAQDWVHFSHHAPSIASLPETKIWNRLTNCFRNNLNDMDLTYAAPYLKEIQLHVAKVARKQGNIATAERWLDSVAKTDSEAMDTLYERSKLLLAQSHYSAAVDTFHTILQSTESSPEYAVLQSKVCVKIAKLLDNAPENDTISLTEHLMNLSSTDTPSANQLYSPVEQAIDSAFEKAVEKSSSSADVWFEYATHHYKEGWRMLNELSREESQLAAILWVRNHLRAALESEEANGRLHGKITDIEKALLEFLQDQSADVGSQGFKESSSLNHVFTHIAPDMSNECKETVIDTLNKLQEAILQRFRSAVLAYFQHLSLDKYQNKEKGLSSTSTSSVMTATLRLLRLLVKYGEALQDLFLTHVETVNIEPWKQIVPQLFSRLHHPAEFVRQIIGRLISRICNDDPQHIVYDVIVGYTSSKTSREAKLVLDTIASQMMQKNAVLWNSTRRMAEELEKITVLWEEKWINKIASLQLDVMQQFQKLEHEVIRLKQMDLENVQCQKIFRDNYDSVMKFIVNSIEKLMTATVNSASRTHHEEWFCETYGNEIQQAFELLQKPKSMEEHRLGWERFQKLHRQLIAESHKVRLLELKDVSPYLAGLKNTVIGLPGIHDSHASCFIQTFGTSVVIIPTKTRPKKLKVVGTDGKKYSYLFKGLEDLHLDERIMQLLRTINGVLVEDRATATRGMKARTYAVIPLSDHSGMIQWVNDAVPLFALYKRWQKQEHLGQMLLANETPDKVAPPAQPRIPTEIFMDKVAKALKAEGLRVTANRKHWPKHVLKKVFMDLVKESPGELLAREIWCNSVDATEWLQKTNSFSRSLAVMSMIGYIIGLGDRHLDNIMVDYKTGEIIHIDYNVCFEKGKRLRVPELVPYRLTQNLFNALGITGVDGVFRTAAEETMRVLRKHKEVLLTLLDAFVYDPLVDWENEAEEVEERQMTEIQANLALIASRLTEKRSHYETMEARVSDTLSGLADLIQSAKSSADQLLIEDDSDEDEMNIITNVEDRLEGAKDRLHDILARCRSWHANHRIAIDMKPQQFNDVISRKGLERDVIPKTIDDRACVDIYREFTSKVNLWIDQRNAVYHECEEEIRTYRELIEPLQGKVLQQDTCQMYGGMLANLVEHRFAKPLAEQVLSRLHSKRTSPALQTLESRTYSFSNALLQYLAYVRPLVLGFQSANSRGNGAEAALRQTQKRWRMMCDHETRTLAMLDSMPTVETLLRRLANEEIDQPHDDDQETNAILKGQLLAKEGKCRLSIFSLPYHEDVGLLALSSYWRVYLSSLRDIWGGHRLVEFLGERETRVLDCLSIMTPTLLELDEACFSICEQLEFFSAESLEAMITTLRNLTPEQMRDYKQQPHISGPLALILDTFHALDYACMAAEMMDDPIVLQYMLYKQTLFLNILQEIQKCFQAIPPHASVPPLIIAWSMASNPVISHSLSAMASFFILHIYIPASNQLLSVMRNRLSLQLSVNQDAPTTSSVDIVKEMCSLMTEQLIMEKAYQYMEKYDRSMKQYHADIARFEWYNAPYVQTHTPLLRSQLIVQLSDAAEKLRLLGIELESLDKTCEQLDSVSPKDSKWPMIQSQWKRAYGLEKEKCTTIMELYNSILQLDSCRENYTQAMLFAKEIEENLQILIEEDVNETPQDTQKTFVVPSTVLHTVKDKLVNVIKLVAEVKSPVDGVGPLLESITIVDTNADNEMKPAQESAKIALDALIKLEKHISFIKEASVCDYSQLIETMDHIGEALKQLFTSLQTLEEFGPENKASSADDIRKSKPISVLTAEEKSKHASIDDTGDNEHTSMYASGQSEPRSQYPEMTEKQSIPDAAHHQATGVDEKELVHTHPHERTGAPVRVMQRSEHVLGIMRRIKAKLEGRDFNVPYKMTVSEQVTRSIEQATSPDNLCMMYEGWTSWL
ncbi:uncharacterized protein BYT42DRAFT_614302 [Radiomyces spectabilis]|uniref:uncharacterized protein n=1 Tax=Radiomyces spectabilis TaxID=64574 RepID=UPI00221E6AFC|nr:uncharacterized protein BYT42DRAFT_614302 [Radiomyces spectabilis]KAI8377636.1 hypothetical protein BYT42DRAFT_614302 [Radiomyces spectabilis]